jgi:eukaryotic-like serine/threonine-protein kinase
VEVPASSSHIRLSDPGGQSGTPSRPPAPVAQRREVTVLVLSFRGSTVPIPRDLRGRITELFSRYGGQIVGDPSSDVEIEAFFGWRESDARDPEYAVRSALAVLRSLPDPRLTAAAGVHVGRVLADPDAQPVMDEQVTSLLQCARELAQIGDRRIGVSPAAARFVRGLFALEALPQPSAVSGLLVGEARAPEEAYGKFVGRREELGRMGRILASAAKRQLRVITVKGPQGIGKTRLLHEVDRRLRKGDYNVGFYLASCPPGGRDVPLSGITAMLQVLSGVQDGDPPERIHAVGPSLRALGLLDDEVTAILAQLGDDRAVVEEPRSLRSAVAKTLLSLTEDRVHVLIWDDAHSLDAASAKLLAAVLRRMRNVRLGIVFAGEPDLVCPVAQIGEEDAFSLAEVSREDAVRLIALRTGLSVPPTELVEYCWRRAGGHPLFLEELIKELIDTRALVTEGREVTRLALDGEMAVPRPLRSIMAARVSRLPPEPLAYLQVGAVLGESFDRDLSAALLGGTPKDADVALSLLEERELVRRVGATSFAFASPLLRDVVEDAIPQDARRDLHARAAITLEGVLGSRLDDHADRVAAHYVASGDRQRATVLFARSARRRLAVGQYDAAAGDALRALDLIDPAVQPAAPTVDLLRTVSAAVDRTRVAPSAPDLMNRLLPYIDRSGTAEERATARIEFANVLAATSSGFAGALALLEEARTLGASSVTLQRSRLVEAELHTRRGDFRGTLRALEELSTGAVERPLQRRAYSLLADAYGALGQRDQALELLDRTELTAEDDAFARAERFKHRALILYFSRDFEGSARSSEQAVELCKASSLTFEVAINLHNQGDALVRMGDFPRAYAVLLESLAACESCGAERLASMNRMYVAYLDAAKGVPGGETQLRSGIEHAEEHGYTWDIVNGRYLLGLLLEQVGLVSNAASEFERCEALARTVDNHLIAEDCAVALQRCRPTRGTKEPAA